MRHSPPKLLCCKVARCVRVKRYPKLLRGSLGGEGVCKMTVSGRYWWRLFTAARRIYSAIIVHYCTRRRANVEPETSKPETVRPPPRGWKLGVMFLPPLTLFCYPSAINYIVHISTNTTTPTLFAVVAVRWRHKNDANRFASNERLARPGCGIDLRVICVSRHGTQRRWNGFRMCFNNVRSGTSSHLVVERCDVSD